jgi:hypothetical protein
MEDNMKQSEIFEKYTDFISDYQHILIWEFDSQVIQKNYDTYSYSLPVEIQLFKALKKIAESKNKTIREKKFTIFMGDFGSAFELFGIGICSRTNAKVKEVITGLFEEIKGYQAMEYGRIPFVPLIPKYRYENGLVIEYTAESKLAGKFRKEDSEISGLKILYRMCESADGLDVKEKYCTDIV